MRTAKNTIAVLVVTALATIALYAGVEIVGRTNEATGNGVARVSASLGQTYLCPVSGCEAVTCHGATTLPAPNRAQAKASAPSGGGQVMTCPRTGCSASSCHGATGAPPPTYGQTADGGSSSATQVMTCPRTGCAAASCHGATGSPPPSGGQSGYGRARRYARQQQDEAPVLQ